MVFLQQQIKFMIKLLPGSVCIASITLTRATQ